MYPRTSAQDVYRCELCGENMIVFLCVVCPFKLCKSCVGSHLDDNPSRHILVKYQDRNTTFVLPTCPTHSPERCQNYCQECDKAVCPSCISSDSHKKHTFLKISEIFQTRKEKINEDTKELEEIVFPSYTSIVQQVESDAAHIEEDYKTLKQRIENKRSKWHNEIDKFVDMLQNETDEMMDIQLKALYKHLQKVKKLRSGIQMAIKSNKDLLYSLNVTEILTYKSQNSELNFLPEKLEVSVPRFISHPINGDLIAEMFGVIVGFSIEKIKENKQNTHSNFEFTKHLLDEPKIKSVIKTEMGCLDQVACQSIGKLWVAGNEGSLKLFKIDVPLDVSLQNSGATASSSILNQLNVDKGSTEIAVARTGDLIYGKKLENTVFILKQDKAEILISLYDWKLLSVCITAFGGFLVCMVDDRKFRCRVVRFNQSSEERQIIQYDQQGKSLYTPGMLNKYVKENRNGDICLADYDAGAVIVTDSTGKFRFRYNGTNVSEKDDQFCPVGIATDSMANILVSDSLQVHIIDKNGQFLRFLHVVRSNPMRLALDGGDNLYIADTNGSVMMVQYYKDKNIYEKMWESVRLILPQTFEGFLK